TRWANSNLPIGLPSLTAAAVVLAAIIAVPVWYSQYLPQPYIVALTAPQQDPQSAADAFASLRRLPGFATTAERLYTNYLRRRSLQATALPAVQALNTALTALPGGAELAAELQADYWDRVVTQRMHAGDRDGALLAAIEALQRSTPARRSRAGELVGPDYPNLLGTVHSDTAVDDLAADAGNATVTLLTADNTVDRWAVGDALPARVLRTTVTAEEHLPLELRRYFAGLPRRPRLLLALQHNAPEQLSVRLRAPSGQEASLSLTPANALGQATYAFDFSRYPELGALLAGAAEGNWALLVTDRVAGVAGEVLAWDIVAAGDARLRDVASVEQPIPEPRQITAARVRLGAAGRLALAWPQQVANAGALQVRDLDTDAVVARVPHTAALRDARFALGGRLILALDGPLLRVWDTARAASLGAIPFSGDDFTTLALALNGRYAAWALPATEPADQPVVVVWDLLGMREAGRVVAASDMAALAVDAAGLRLAQGGADNFVRVWSVPDGELLREFVLSAPARALHFDGSGRWLAADDLSNTFRLWDLEEAAVPVLERVGTSRWQAGFAADSSLLIFGAFDRPYETVYLEDRRRGVTALRHPALPDADRPLRRLPVALLERRELLVTADAGAGLKLWRLPPPAGGLLAESRIEPGLRSALSHDGRLIAVGTGLEDLRLYAAGEPAARTFGTAVQAAAAAQRIELVDLRFSSGQEWLAAAATDGLVHVWETVSGRPALPPVRHADGPALLARFVAADRYLVTASRLQVQVTDMQTGATVGRLRIQTANPDVAYAEATGQLFVADGTRGVVRWDWDTGTSAAVVPGSTAVTRLAVSADGRRLVTAGADLQLRLWDLSTGKMLPDAIQAAGEVDAMWLTANGRRLTVQAGHWLHTAAAAPAGLAHRYTRLLPAARLRVQPQARGETALLLRPGGAGRPTVEPFALAEPDAAELPGQAATLRSDWSARLALEFNSAGELVQVGPSPAVD
ncbi:MAG: WD40 repeat domain-containing protein, partial [Gammaproteobacteria bacterium]|nr:WD40 repeat domain-containing protein [Gammaproteobacteria bacterium]